MRNKMLLKYFLLAAGGLILGLGIRHFFIQGLVVDGQSMEPTLYDGDLAIISKSAYHTNEPERFDIILFAHGNDYFIKRVIGLPGETVQITENGEILINGEILEENYGKEQILSQNTGLAVNPVEVHKEEYFVMGDNRNHSLDSRFAEVGNVAKEQILGKVRF